MVEEGGAAGVAAGNDGFGSGGRQGRRGERGGTENGAPHNFLAAVASLL